MCARPVQCATSVAMLACTTLSLVAFSLSLRVGWASCKSAREALDCAGLQGVRSLAYEEAKPPPMSAPGFASDTVHRNTYHWALSFLNRL
jgi:hypothetical protein